LTTVGDAIKAALDANWAGSGGAEPALYSTEDIGKEWPTDADWIKILGNTYRRKRRRRNDSFVGERYLIDMLVHSMNDANSEERLDTIVTEIYRIVTPTNVTGFHIVDIVDESRAASDDYLHFMATLTVELIIKSTDSAVTPGSGGTGDVTFPADVEVLGDLTVGGSDVIVTGTGQIRSSTTGGNVSIYSTNVWNNGSVLQCNDAGAGFRFLYDGVEIGSLNSVGDLQIDGGLKTDANKSSDIGATGVAWDNVYADDFVNESPFKLIEKPLAAVKAIQHKDGKLDYKTLPDWVRTIGRDHSKDKTHQEEIGEDEEGNPLYETVIDELAPKDIISEKGYSVNRMVILLYQALQEANEKIEALEAKIK